MDRKLLDYLPPVLREVLEFQSVSAANEPELRLIWGRLERILKNQFLETADTLGLSIWEQELRILPKDTDTVEFRKARVKALWNRQAPYTLRWLHAWLDGLCGSGAHTEHIKAYTLNICLDYTKLQRAEQYAAEIALELPELIPAHLVWRFQFQDGCEARLAAGAVCTGSGTVDGAWALKF